MHHRYGHEGHQNATNIANRSQVLRRRTCPCLKNAALQFHPLFIVKITGSSQFDKFCVKCFSRLISANFGFNIPLHPVNLSQLALGRDAAFSCAPIAQSTAKTTE